MDTQGKGESMAEKGNENAPEAAKKKAKGGSSDEAANNSPESGPLGGDESPGHAPMGGGDQQHNRRPGRKSTTWATRGTPRGTAPASGRSKPAYTPLVCRMRSGGVEEKER